MVRMSRILVVHGTRSGATAHVAELLATRLRAAGHHVEDTPASSDPAPDHADLTVVGSGIVASRWYPEVLDWIHRHAEQLRGRAAVFNVSLTAANPDRRDAALALNAPAASLLDPVLAEAFAGRYEPQAVSWWGRWWLRLLGKGPQDHLDPGAVERWADAIADHLSGRQAH